MWVFHFIHKQNYANNQKREEVFKNVMKHLHEFRKFIGKKPHRKCHLQCVVCMFLLSGMGVDVLMM